MLHQHTSYVALKESDLGLFYFILFGLLCSSFIALNVFFVFVFLFTTDPRLLEA